LEFQEKPQLVNKVNGKNVSYKMQINIPKDYYVARLKESNVGMLEFDYTLKTNKGDVVYKILIGGDDADNPIIKAWQIYQGASSGPYSESQSNLEDNGIINVELPLDNIYGVELNTGILNCSCFTMSDGKEIQIPAKKVVR
jgi:hypothetical protein